MSFLIQLGRVKDTFALDKMFFMVNAIDLANDEEEMHGVLDYVEEQLIAFGIRNPHLYPVSSMQALKEKMAGTAPVSSRYCKLSKNLFMLLLIMIYVKLR